VGARALLLAAVGAQAILLGSGVATSSTDLRTLLAAPPAASWIEVGPATDVLVGAFTAKSYAAYLRAEGTSPGSTEFTMNLYGFTRGYGLEWEQRGSHDILDERVFEFRTDQGARSWYSLLKRVDQTAKEYTNDIPMPTSVPNSIGSAFKWPDGLEDTVNFEKGNLVYVIDTGADSNDLSAMAVAQASAEYESAPAHTDVPPGAGPAVNDLVHNVEIAAGALIVFLGLVAAIAVPLVARRRRQAVWVAPGGLTMSPDGAYWWDGGQWRDASVEAPPTAQRSDDGAYWWDGRTWRPAPARRPFG
jgi:hypothetical protein